LKLSTETTLTLLVVVFPVLGCFALWLVWRFWL
jgi:hypothetical protein